MNRGRKASSVRALHVHAYFPCRSSAFWTSWTRLFLCGGKVKSAGRSGRKLVQYLTAGIHPWYTPLVYTPGIYRMQVAPGWNYHLRSSFQIAYPFRHFSIPSVCLAAMRFPFFDLELSSPDTWQRQALVLIYLYTTLAFIKSHHS